VFYYATPYCPLAAISLNWIGEERNKRKGFIISQPLERQKVESFFVMKDMSSFYTAYSQLIVIHHTSKTEKKESVIFSYKGKYPS
jgi:hypothetical protein